jgi:hypothetical protein
MSGVGAAFLPTNFVGTGGKVFWVGNRSGLPAGDGSKPEYPLSTVNAALAKCVSGRGDIVYIMPGHAETYTSNTSCWSSVVAGTQIIGLGNGTARPTFTYAGSSTKIAIAVDNVRVENCIFNIAGARGSTTALTVTVGFAITGAGFTFVGNEVNCAVDTDQLCTTAFTLSAAADDATFARNYIFGGTAGTVTGIIVTTGAVDRLKIIGNHMAACATAQLLDLSNAACVDHLILDNILQNKLDTTTAVIKPHATSIGLVHNNIWITAAAGTAPASSGWTTYTTTYWFGLNYCATVSAATAIVSPAVDS